jgi:hypothetical protein
MLCLYVPAAAGLIYSTEKTKLAAAMSKEWTKQWIPYLLAQRKFANDE